MNKPSARVPILEGFEGLVAEVHSRSPLHRSLHHGDHHWRLVAWTGAELYEESGVGDPFVILLFGLFHDSQRENEFDDPDHGRRGGELAKDLLSNRVGAALIDRLVEACALHTEAGPTDDPTLGTCWDADRLNLWRVGKRPEPRYLSTSAAKRAERIEWARDLQHEEPTWTEVLERYVSLGTDPPAADC